MSKASRALLFLLFVAGAVVGWGSFWSIVEAPQKAYFVSAASCQGEQNKLFGEPCPVVVVFAGDIMLDRNVARAATQEGVPALFAGVTGLFRDSDLRVANLEGTITTEPSVALQNSSILRFTFNPDVAHEALATLNLSAVSLANNHALDFGRSGYNSTRAFLSQWSIPSFGEPLNTAGLLSARLESRGQSFCLVGYHALFKPTTSTVVQEIESVRLSCTHVIVFAHWGVEYSATSTTAQQDAAHAFIDAGADMVVGAHPHVVEPYEEYKGKPIYYSLGNFVFDQDFSWATQHGLVLKADFYPNRLQVTPIPISIDGGRVSIAQGDDKKRILGNLGQP